MQSVQISRILHAGYLFECGASQILFDPLFENPYSRNCYAFPQIQFDLELVKKMKPQAIFISHYHDDHLSFESLQHLEKTTPLYIYCIYDEILDLIRQLGFVNVHSLQIGESVHIGEFVVTPRLALDSDVDCVLQIHAGGLKILNVVDAWLDPATVQQLSAQAPWDLVLWPFQTLRELAVLSPGRAEPAEKTPPEEWLQQLQQLIPRHVVPSSCQFKFEPTSWYNQAFFPISYQQFEISVRQVLPQTNLFRLNPSESVQMDSGTLTKVESLNFIKTVGDQNADYDFDPQMVVPTTAEISKFFAPLADKQTQIVFNYCKTGLIKKLQQKAIGEDSYFQKPRAWQLKVYEHTGLVHEFHYQIYQNQIERVEASQQLSWITEIPISRLYGALEMGESLSSLYVRINDFVFDDQIEAELQGVDLLEDPLLRSLYQGEVGTYQRAQLRRLSDLA